MQRLIERSGAVATVAPSMQEMPLERNTSVLPFLDALLDGTIDVVIFMTGVGARYLLSAVEITYSRDKFLVALQNCCLVVRGPKPATVLREWGVRIDHRVPEPNTWRQILDVIDAGLSFPKAAECQSKIDGKTVAIQEYGKPSDELSHELQRRGACVISVPVYRWEMPDDTRPLETAIRDTISGRFDVLMFTSAVQLLHVLELADSAGLRDEWMKSANGCVVASIGPTTSESLQAVGLDVDFEPSHPKMGTLVRETMPFAAELLKKSRPRG